MPLFLNPLQTKLNYFIISRLFYLRIEKYTIKGLNIIYLYHYIINISFNTLHSKKKRNHPTRSITCININHPLHYSQDTTKRLHKNLITSSQKVKKKEKENKSLPQIQIPNHPCQSHAMPKPPPPPPRLRNLANDSVEISLDFPPPLAKVSAYL